MNRFKLSIILVCMLSGFSGIAQSISPAPGNSTICPGERQIYTVNPNPDFSGCSSFTWTITNGSFDFGANPAVTIKTTTEFNVDVYWNDVAGNGTIKVTSNCTEGALSVGPLSYAVRSLKGRTPANALSNPTALPYCSTASVYLSVDVMYLDNTGGTTGITQQYADGYEWILPTGWKSSGTAGTISTTTNFITVTPDNDCVGGSVSVKAYVDCPTKRYSSSASINLSRPKPTLTITPQAGYTGPGCGATQPVTFTVTPISCASNYTWVFPIGWAAGPFVAGNSVTLTPSGGESDGGTIYATANLSCTSITSTAYPLNFTKPAILAPSAICYGGNNVTLNNIAPSVSVNWSVSDNMVILSGQGTSSLVVRALNSIIRNAGTIDAAVSCPNTTVPTKSVWVGQPNFATPISGPSQLVVDYSGLYQVNNALGATGSYTWSIQPNWYIYTSGPYGGGQAATVVAASTGFKTLSISTSNTCGSASTSKSIEGTTSCDPAAMSVRPNPSKRGDVIVNVIPPPPCDPQPSASSSATKPNKKGTLVLQNSMGEILLQKNFDGTETELKGMGLKPGIYYIKVQYEGRNWQEKLLVE